MRPPKKWQFWFAAKMISRKYQKTMKYEILVPECLRATIKNELTIVTACFFPKTVLFCSFFFPGKVDVGLTNAFSDGKQLFYWLTQIFGKGDQKQTLPGKKNTLPFLEGNPIQYTLIQNSFQFVHLSNALLFKVVEQCSNLLSLHFLHLEISFWFEIHKSPNEIL